MKIGIDIGKERIYSKAFKEMGVSDAIKWEVQKVEDAQQIKISFLSKNSEHRQGIWIATDNGIEVNGVMYPQIELWEDTAPKEVIIRCFTKVGLLSLYNIWDDGDGRESQAYSSAMRVETKGNLSIYRCNDYGVEANFDKLIFSIEKL